MRALVSPRIAVHSIGWDATHDAAGIGRDHRLTAKDDLVEAETNNTADDQECKEEVVAQQPLRRLEQHSRLFRLVDYLDSAYGQWLCVWAGADAFAGHGRSMQEK